VCDKKNKITCFDIIEKVPGEFVEKHIIEPGAEGSQALDQLRVTLAYVSNGISAD
jgi:hypothetical protein